MYEKSVLPNGLRVLSSNMPHTRSVSIGFFVGAGSRYEDDAAAGASHYLEHVLFKGTETVTFQTPSDWLEGFNAAAAAFIDGIISGQQQMMDSAMARATLQLTLAPYKASDTGMAVDPRTIVK